MQSAVELDLVPEHTFGKTQHKTLQARLSEHILKFRDKSLVYRTSPGRFFLREFMDSGTIDPRYKVEFHARRRKKDLSNENVLVIPRNTLDENNISGFVNDPREVLSLIKRTDAHYKVRKHAEEDFNIKQFVTYVIVVKNDRVLSYRRGKFSNAGKELLQARSIGFGGHVSDLDADFLDRDTFGIKNNATRELLEELWLEHDEQINLQRSETLQLLSFINVDDTQEARKHIACVLLYFCTPEFEPKKGELSINDLRWLDVTRRPNDLDDFELWSKILIEKLMTPQFRQNLYPDHIAND